MRIACLQLNPVIGKIQSNITKANQIIEKSLQQLDRPFDLLILPELALTGYNYKSREHIEPYLEPTENGPTSRWAAEISRKYKCFTLVGYPEWNAEHKAIYNSAILTSPSGSTIHHYRKTHLYESDVTWGCSESPDKAFNGFEFVLNKDFYTDNAPPSALIKAQVGICMDLNPYKFEAPFNAFEFSGACFRNQAKLILCPMAWLSQKSPSIAEESGKSDVDAVPIVQDDEKSIRYDLLYKKELDVREQQKTEISTVDYWILRFLPFLKHPMVEVTRYYNKVTLVCCNRTGQEDNVLYGGSSLIIQFDSNAANSTPTGTENKSVTLLGSLGVAQEGILVRDVEIVLRDRI